VLDLSRKHNSEELIFQFIGHLNCGKNNLDFLSAALMVYQLSQDIKQAAFHALI
jgi:hypothetical protein